MKKLLFLCFFSCLSIILYGQLGDHFDDGNINADPIWTPINSIYVANDQGEMQLNDTIPGTSYIYTPILTSDSTIWEFYFRLEFDPSPSNKLKVFLGADMADFTSDLNGYFIEVGEGGATDKLEFGRQDGSNSTILLQSQDGSASTTPEIRVRIVRDQIGNWDLLADFNGGFDFQSVGNTFDDTYSSGLYFGFQCTYSVNRRDKFFFDDILIDSLEFDTEPPMLISAIAINAQQVDVVFNEGLNPANIGALGLFNLDNGVTVLSASLDASDPTLVHLTVSPLPNDITYTLTTMGIEDLAANASIEENTTFYFFQPDEPDFSDIVINEIFADPNPTIGLPVGEFIELYNRSNKTFDLDGYKFSDTTSTTTLPSYILRPDSFIILTSNAFFSEYESFGPTLNVGTLPSLNDKGDRITLKDPSGEILHTLFFTSDWYQDDEKAKGGVSIEMINPDLFCKEAENWRGSDDFSGGTPGIQNAVFVNIPDNTPPKLIDAIPLSDQEVLLIFDEIMDETSLLTPGFYDIQTGIGMPSDADLQGDNNSVVLITPSPFQDGQTYTITVDGVQDCVGNPIQSDNSTSFTFYVTEPAERYDIIINEIYPDQTPSNGLPEVEFVELYNRSDKAINLQGFTFDEGTTEPSVFPIRILLPNQYLILQKINIFNNYSDFGDLLQLPAFDLTNVGETLIFKDAGGNIIDAVSYLGDWFESGKDEGGFSLERINSFAPCDADESNWQTAIAPLGATPGTQNSVFPDPIPENGIPQLLNAYVDRQAPTILELFFDRALDENSTITVENYLISPAGLNIVDQQLTPPLYTTVRLRFDTPIEEETIYTITIDNIKDCLGTSITAPTNTAQFAISVLPESGDIVLNEILNNPSTGGVRFIELYNRSNKVLDASDLILSKRDEDGNIDFPAFVSNSRLIFPNDYTVITSSPEDIQARYQTLDPGAFIRSTVPTYDDKEDNVILMTEGSVVLDELAYNRDFHNDLIDDLNGVSLERIDPNGNTQEEGNWHSAAATVGHATPTYQNSQFFTSVSTNSGIIDIPVKTISPDDDGFQDVLIINYQPNQPGYLANIDIFDARGRLIRKIANNNLLANGGSIKWDGTLSFGKKARIGIYILWIELINPEGEVERIKETIVVAGKLN